MQTYNIMAKTKITETVIAETGDMPAAPAPDHYGQLLAVKQAAGLSFEQATEVVERQRKTDIEQGVKIADEA